MRRFHSNLEGDPLIDGCKILNSEIVLSFGGTQMLILCDVFGIIILNYIIYIYIYRLMILTYSLILHLYIISCIYIYTYYRSL